MITRYNFASMFIEKEKILLVIVCIVFYIFIFWLYILLIMLTELGETMGTQTKSWISSQDSHCLPWPDEMCFSDCRTTFGATSFCKVVESC